MPCPDADDAFLPEYVSEPDVSTELDRELCALISSAFNQPHTAFFQVRRYAQEMPSRRYLFRSREGRLVAHLAVHDKRLGVAEADLAIGGMAEVCVHEAARGRGLARRLLARAHRELQERAVEFAFLFGDPKIYRSSGYHGVGAPIRSYNPLTGQFDIAPHPLALVKPLGARAWPEGPIDLRGPLF